METQNRKITYEVKEPTKFEEKETGKMSVFNTPIMSYEPVEWTWRTITHEYDEEMYEMCKDEERRGKCRNIKITGGKN